MWALYRGNYVDANAIFVIVLMIVNDLTLVLTAAGGLQRSTGAVEAARIQQ